MFEPQSYLVDAVKKRDIEQVKIALSTYLSKNPTNEQNEVMQAAEYAESRLSDPLWVEHDGLYIEPDSSKWTTDYLGQLKSDLGYNFSKERFKFILEVGKKVRPLKRNFSQASSSPETINTTNIPVRVTDMGKPNTKWLVIAGLGGIAILGVALFLYTRNHN
ncbi:hypothetical protein J45TS6_35780 [Paenibacillus sp. J45TS6]|uniref:hypothetical protein n=1 Tax=Paenibacillus sp. J45TS6 TaxID=2807196 RepID=UPI001B0F8ECC|nr:hypothetical protein [Paenibacillus sp. J45TS6]GIP45119.1 hypothetical protein J45TS6_35780 [Paenibacillus sp. J45TS6]